MDKNYLKCFYMVLREISIDDQHFRAAGINNVIAPIKFRGMGFATKILSETKKYLFENLNSDLGLLFCSNDLVPFYNRIGWYTINCPVYFEQPTGTKIWTANTMLLTNGRIIRTKKIDLNGLPW